MKREEFDKNPKSDGSENNTRCYFPWGWCPSATIDLRWNCVTIPSATWRGFTGEFKDWCCENINTKWTHGLRSYQDQIKFYFEDEGTAFLFKLTWA